MRRWMVPCVGGRASLHMCHLPTRQSLRFPDRWSILPVPLIATASSVAVMLPRIVPTGRAAGYARQRVIKRVPKIVQAKRPAAKTNNAADQSAAAAPKEWKFTGWVSTKRDIKAAVDECVQNIRPKFGDVRPDVCFVFSSHQSDDKLRRIPALVKNALKPRALFGSSSFGVFGAGGAMPQGQEVANKQALSIVAATMPDVEIYPFHLRTPSLPSFPPEFDWATHTLPKRKNGGAADDDEISSAMFVITDGFDFCEDELLQRLDFAFPSCPKFGGLASSRNVRLFVNDKAYPEGAAGILVHGKFRLDQIKAESFRPIGRSYTVSEVTPYSEKDFETFLTSVGAEDEGEEGGDDGEHDDGSKPSFTYASDGDDESEESDGDEEAEDLSSVIHTISGRTVYDVVQELASDLSSRDKSRFLSGQFLVGVDPRVPSSSETKPRPPSVFVARNVKEMEVDSESNEGGYLTLYENVPQGKHIQFCLKDRNKGLADLRAQLARLNLPPVPAAVASTVPPAPFCPLTQQRAGTSEVGMLGFSSIGRSLYAKDAAAQIELAHEGVFPLAGRTPLDSVADQLVADMHATADTSEVQSFIEGELAPSLDRPAATTASGNNFAAGPTTAVEGRHNDDDWMAQLDETTTTTTTTTTTPTPQQQKTERKNEYDDDIVSYSQKAKKPQQPEESASSRQQLEAFFDDDDEDSETRRMKKVKEEEEEEEEDSSATDASVIAERFGSRVTFGGMFCKGEFFTTDTRQEHEDGGSTNNNNNNTDDDDDRSTLLHGYINSIAVIMPPKSYHQHPKEK